jgi:hypothetical protein
MKTIPEKTIGARTKPFFSHCTGRMLRNKPFTISLYP